MASISAGRRPAAADRVVVACCDSKTPENVFGSVPAPHLFVNRQMSMGLALVSLPRPKFVGKVVRVIRGFRGGAVGAPGHSFLSFFDFIAMGAASRQPVIDAGQRIPCEVAAVTMHRTMRDIAAVTLIVTPTPGWAVSAWCP